jgi:hypothetical protein
VIFVDDNGAREVTAHVGVVNEGQNVGLVVDLELGNTAVLALTKDEAFRLGRRLIDKAVTL